MDVLWAAEGSRWLTVREVHGALSEDRDLAYTTVMTVLDRLARKELVGQQREGRAFLYRARASRAELTAELMHEALDDFTTHDRGQALVAFVGEASADDIVALRRALASLDG
jgi:predicted transcriptional regulator